MIIDRPNYYRHWKQVADEAGEHWVNQSPKEQPPRNLSGKRTALAFATLWKESLK
jgi:SH3-like domain-containing protein